MFRLCRAALLAACTVPLAGLGVAKAADLDYPDEAPPPMERPAPPPEAPAYAVPPPVAPVYVVPRPVVYPGPLVYPRPYWRPYWRPGAPGCGYEGRCYRPY